MFLTLDSFFNDEPTSIVPVDSSVIDVSEFENDEDQTFLMVHGSELIRIDAKAEHAKEQIIKAIDAKAEDAKGRHIYEIQERFKEGGAKSGLLKFFHSLGYWSPHMNAMGLSKPENAKSLNTAFSWANSYRAALEMQEKLSGLLTPEEIQARVAALPKTALATIYTSHSEADREKIYEDVANGRTINNAEARELSKSPEVKLSKAEELLDRARARKIEAEEHWEEVKASPDITPDMPEYTSASNATRDSEKAIANFEAKVAELQKQVEAKEAELMKFKHDSEFARQERIKLLTDALTIGVPQATADLNKYIADADHYPSEVRRHMDEQIKVLADMCGDYLARI